MRITNDLSHLPDDRFAAELARLEAAAWAEEAVRERMARVLCEADTDVDGRHWTWDDTAEPARDHYRAMADAALAVIRTPVEVPTKPCESRGPRIGSEGKPICRLPAGHDGAHRPDPEDGWGSSMNWGDFS